MTIASVVAAPVAGRLVTRLGVRTTASSGLTLVAVGLLLMTPMSESSGLVLVLSGMVIGEIGFMLSNVPLTIAGSGGTSEGERGLAAGLLNSSIQLGNAWGLGVVATVVAAVTTARRGGSQLRGTRRWLAVGALCLRGLRRLGPADRPSGAAKNPIVGRTRHSREWVKGCPARVAPLEASPRLLTARQANGG
jgi:MFS family permease